MRIPKQNYKLKISINYKHQLDHVKRPIPESKGRSAQKDSSPRHEHQCRNGTSRRNEKQSRAQGYPQNVFKYF